MSDSLSDAALLLERRADHFLRRCLLYLAALGAVWSLLFWGGYYVSKRLVGMQPSRPSHVMEHPNSR
jgi:hypothetical protein